MQVKELNVMELAALLQSAQGSGEPPLILDVREAWECSTAPFAGAVHIPMREVPARFAELDRNRTVICLCHHGTRSRQVAMFLEHQQFADVYNLSGGIDAWSTRIDASVPRY